MNRKAQLVAVGCMVALAFHSCGRDESGQGQAKTTIVFWHSFVASSVPALNELLSQFEAEHPGIHVDAQYVPTGDALVQKLITAIQSNTAPDIAWIHTDFLDKLVEANALVPLEDFIRGPHGLSPADLADFFPELLDPGVYDGKTYTLPMEATALALLYNRELFRKAGLDPDKPPATWSELERYAKMLTADRDKDGRTDCTGFLVPVFPSSSDLNIWMVQQWLPFLWQGGGQEMSPDRRRVAFNSPPGVAALELWRRMYDDLGIRRFTMAHDMAFASGKLAMVMDGPWDLPRYRSVRGLDWAVAPLPAGSSTSATVVAGEHLAIFRQSRKAQDAWTFVRWVVDPEVQARFSISSGYLPVRKSTMERPIYREYLAKDAAMAAFVNMMSIGRSRTLPLTHRVEFNRTIAEAIERATSGGEDPKKCLDEAAKVLNRVLAQGGE
jgi:ABC-type glycerol-3-phosphate transport system substrate-binding protein